MNEPERGASIESVMGRVAAIDIGTNSVLLLVAEARSTDDGRGFSLQPVVERATITRLGQGVDKTRRLADDAVERTLKCLAEYGAELSRLGVTRVDAVGTSAMRDAAGAEAFRERARALLGVEPRVIAGEEEARLTYIGGLSGLALTGPVSVFDIGGGSTEIIRGGNDRGQVSFALSLNIGSVRLTERHIRTDPPTASELAACRADIERELDAIPPGALGAPLVGVAGTVTTIAAIARHIDPYEGSKAHGVELSLDEVIRVSDELAHTPLAQRVNLPGLSPKRADVIVTGALLCRIVVERSGARALTVSDRGVRWGVADALARALPHP